MCPGDCVDPVSQYPFWLGDSIFRALNFSTGDPNLPNAKFYTPYKQELWVIKTTTAKRCQQSSRSVTVCFFPYAKARQQRMPNFVWNFNRNTNTCTSVVLQNTAKLDTNCCNLVTKTFIVIKSYKKNAWITIYSDWLLYNIKFFDHNPYIYVQKNMKN